MALEAISIELKIPKTVYDAIPLAKKVAFRDAVRAMKALAVKVNERLPNEEMTVRAVRHTCYHDDPTVGGLYPLGKPCEPGQEI